jgi:predicted NBD/HSP70 family sugar kinase
MRMDGEGHGLAIGGTKVAAGVVDADGRVLARLPLDTHSAACSAPWWD